MNDNLLKGAFGRFTVKMILNNLVVFCGAVVNGIFISRYLGTETMAAFQLNLPLFFTMMMFSQIISVGVQNNCAKSLGAGRAEEAGEYYSLAVLLYLPLSFVCACSVCFEAERLAALLGAQGTAASLLPDAAANAFYFGGGIFGMGFVMPLSYLTSMAVMCAGFFFEKGCVSFIVKGLRPKRLLPVFRIGLPSAVDRFYKTVQLFVINKVLLAVSSGAAIAAFADINTLNNVFNSVVMGFGASTLTMAGVFVGEGDRDSLKALFRLAVKKTLLSTGALVAAVFLAAPLLIGIFVPQGETWSMRVRDACRPFDPKRCVIPGHWG